MVRSYPLFLLGTLLFFAILLAWMAWARHADFNRHHRTVALQTAAGLADELAGNIDGHKRLVRLFAREQAPLLRRLVRNPDAPRLQRAVAEKLREYFPDHYAFTLAGPDGAPYLEEFGERIGPLCREDIIAYARRNTNRPRVHPGPGVHHFDILARIEIDGQPRILFVSFPVELLASLLANVQLPEHELYLVLPEPAPLIEVTAQGPRNRLPRTDYHLSAAEKQRLLARRPIVGTRWEIFVLARPDLFTTFSRDLLVQSLLMFIPFLLFTLAMWWLFRRQEQLRQEAEIARDEFLATVSHELRTPLTAIHGALELIANGITGPIGKRTREMVQIACKNSSRLSLLVNDLLDMRRLESGNLELDMQPVDLVWVIHRAIEENSSYLEQFQVRCQFEPDRAFIPVQGDRNRLIQVLTNLLSNAAKYGPDNETVRIRTRCAHGTVRVSVIDRGEGVPPEFRPRLFEKFTRHDSSDTRTVSGTGLGLSIARAIVEAHGGRIGFFAYRSVGTTFYFELPLRERDEERRTHDAENRRQDGGKL